MTILPYSGVCLSATQSFSLFSSVCTRKAEGSIRSGRVLRPRRRPKGSRWCGRLHAAAIRSAASGEEVARRQCRCRRNGHGNGAPGRARWRAVAQAVGSRGVAPARQAAADLDMMAASIGAARWRAPERRSAGGIHGHRYRRVGELSFAPDSWTSTRMACSRGSASHQRGEVSWPGRSRRVWPRAS
jgi:hypothetical protein